MKSISYEVWVEKFPKLAAECEVDADSCTFYDNGAVSDTEGDFIVKLDEVERICK